MANTFRRFSVAFKLGKNQKNSPMDSTTTLAEFLNTTKQEYLKAINDTPSRGGEWTVVMGNEAGDLDTMASSIAYAWVESEVHKRPTVPLIPLERDDLDLRAENIYAFKLAGILKPREQLLFLTDIPHLEKPTTPFPSQRFALVDHNKIKDRYLLNNSEARIVAVIDHREDEGLYKETALPRIVLPCGSCCSHIAASVLPSHDKLPSGVTIPRELATLLLCGIMIDTDGLRPGGKALQVDRDAAATLIPLSTYAQTINPSLYLTLTTGTKPNGNAVYDEKSMKDLASLLSAKKTDLSHLGTRDLLRRDYKEYEYRVDWLPGSPTVRVGLSTIPVPLKNWAREGTVEKEILLWMKNRGLHIHGAITSFKEKPNKKSKEVGKGKEKEKKGKARREQVWMVLNPAVFDGDNDAYSAEAKNIQVEKLAKRFWSHLEADGSLKLEKHTQLELNKNGALPKEVKAKVYHQTDPTPTRKYTAPLVKNILTQGVSTPSAEDHPNEESSQANGTTPKAKV
ncbi:DHH phosphoesterase [Macrolepiota fuliginosa MF-IS2]|uniref:DHH phosphoesterase n=1 Tax=Macrolepiota fuliginosa MF-IS2 TaxID=1400762 RepID=A0A9P5XKE1_9AGAR|nr:DHH phosphoesterase [Macrolepiota fuliginosa MF-IS2]